MRQKYKLVKVSGIYYMFKSNFDIRIDGTARSIIVITTGLTNTRGGRGLNTGFPEFFSLIPGFSGEFFVIHGLPEVFSIITGSGCFLIDFATILYNIVSYTNFFL